MTHQEKVAAAISNLDTAVGKSQEIAAQHIALASASVIEAGRAGAKDAQAVDTLIQSMLCNERPEIRHASRIALAESEDPRAKSAFRLEDILTKFSGYTCHPFIGEVGKVKETPELLEELKKLNHDPVFVDRMIRHVASRSGYAADVALVIRDTPLPEKQAAIRNMLVQHIGDQFEFSARDDMYYLPLALDPKVPANVATLLRTLREGSTSFHGGFEVSAIRTLAEARTPEVLDYLLQRTKSYYVQPCEAFATAEAIKLNMNDTARATLLPLIDGNLFKTAWVMAGFEGKQSFSKLLRTIGLRFFGTDNLHYKRAEVAVALSGSDRELAKKILTAGPKGRPEIRFFIEHFARQLTA